MLWDQVHCRWMITLLEEVEIPKLLLSYYGNESKKIIWLALLRKKNVIFAVCFWKSFKKYSFELQFSRFVYLLTCCKVFVDCQQLAPTKLCRVFLHPNGCHINIEKIGKNLMKLTLLKGGILAFRFFSLCRQTVDTQKLVDFWGKHDFLDLAILNLGVNILMFF